MSGLCRLPYLCTYICKTLRLLQQEDRILLVLRCCSTLIILSVALCVRLAVHSLSSVFPRASFIHFKSGVDTGTLMPVSFF